MPAFSANLTNIIQYNPGVNLPDRAIKQANAGTLVLAGFGSLHPGGSARRGCIEWLRFGKGSEDLTHMRINGTVYTGGNINDFRDALSDAALHGKCINFCHDRESNEMTMLNVYPQCCCECDQTVD